MSTRFSEVILLRNIKSVQFDQGSNFMSAIFQQVMTELGIHQFKLTMKLWLERNTRERTLESNNGVVLLLFILLTFLLIRYYGPYKVNKKVNYLSCGISAPGI